MPGVPLNITLPSSGDAWPTWANAVRSALSTLITDIEADVVTAEITENANHVMNGYAVTDAQWYVVRSGNTTAIPTNAIGIKDGEWYATNSNAVSVKLTHNDEIADLFDDRTETVPAKAAWYLDAVGGAATVGTGGQMTFNGDWNSYYSIQPSRVGTRLKALVISINKANASATTVNVHKVSTVGAIGAAIGTGSSTTTGDTTISISIASPTAIVAGEHWVVFIDQPAGNNTNYNIQFTYDKIA